MHRQGVFTHHSTEPYIRAVANATPEAQAFYGPCPLGYCWYVESATYHISAHTAVAELAISPEGKLPAPLSSWDRAQREWWFGAAAVDGQAAIGEALFVPPGYYLVAAFAGGTLAQNDVCVMSFQIAEHELNPRYLMSEEEIEQVRKAHEHPTAPLAQVATASERAV